MKSKTLTLQEAAKEFDIAYATLSHAFYTDQNRPNHINKCAGKRHYYLRNDITKWIRKRGFKSKGYDEGLRKDGLKCLISSDGLRYDGIEL